MNCVYSGMDMESSLYFLFFVLFCFVFWYFWLFFFFFFWLHPIARGTSAPGPGTEPGPWQWKWRILTTGCCCLVTNSCLTLATPWTAALQASLRFTISESLLKLMSAESMTPSNHLVLCCPLLLPSIFPSISIFSNKLTLCIRWPKYWSVSLNPSDEYSLGCQGNPSISPFWIFPGTLNTVSPLHTNLHVVNLQRC